jgi:hypothetical protein
MSRVFLLWAIRPFLRRTTSTWDLSWILWLLLCGVVFGSRNMQVSLDLRGQCCFINCALSSVAIVVGYHLELCFRLFFFTVASIWRAVGVVNNHVLLRTSARLALIQGYFGLVKNHSSKREQASGFWNSCRAITLGIISFCFKYFSSERHWVSLSSFL